MGWGEPLDHDRPASSNGESARMLLVAFALKCGLDEVHADLCVSEALARRPSAQQVTVTGALALLNDIAQCAENGRHDREPA